MYNFLKCKLTRKLNIYKTDHSNKFGFLNKFLKYSAKHNSTNSFFKSCFVRNIYGGIDVNMQGLESSDYQDKNEFCRSFKEKIELVNEQEPIKAISIIIPCQYAEVIPILSNDGFKLHYAKNSSIGMYKWLDTKIESKIPEYPKHQIGVGAIIVNSNKEVVLIRERYMRSKNNEKWKFVTGLVETTENVLVATQREVVEEIGIKNVEVCGIWFLREIFPIRMDLHDICFFNLCVVSDSIKTTDLIVDSNELLEAKFFSFDEARELLNKNNCTKATVFGLNKLFDVIDQCDSNQNYLDVLKTHVISYSNNTETLFKFEVRYHNKKLYS